MPRCKICGFEMLPCNDCGGDCMFCLAAAGDPDCLFGAKTVQVVATENRMEEAMLAIYDELLLREGSRRNWELKDYAAFRKPFHQEVIRQVRPLLQRMAEYVGVFLLQQSPKFAELSEQQQRQISEALLLAVTEYDRMHRFQKS